MPAPTCYLTVIKRFSYRGNANEEWSNSYALTGTTPADAAAWRTLFDALVLQEKTLYPATCSVVGGYGYDQVPVDKGDHAIWSVDLTVAPNAVVAGTYAGAGRAIAGDQAGWIRWGLDRYNTLGKRVYLRKYFHGGMAATNNPDLLEPSWSSALTAFGAKMWDGSFAGGRKICSPPNRKLGLDGGEVPIGSATSPYLTTRTLKRRGKRPPVTAP